MTLWAASIGEQIHVVLLKAYEAERAHANIFPKLFY